MSDNITTQEYNERIKHYIKRLKDYKERDYTYEYIGKDNDGLYLYDYIPNYNKGGNFFKILNERYYLYISYPIYNSDVADDIFNLFKDGEIILIEEGIKRIEGLIKEETPVGELFNLLSEVQGVEIKPYDRFDIRNTDEKIFATGPYYLDENFKRYDVNNIECFNEIILRGILTGEMKVLKCKKAVVLTEDDIICLRYYLKNGYRYITNNKFIDFEEVHKLQGFKNKPEKIEQPNNHWIYNNYNEDSLKITDELSFIHYEYPENWDIEELLEQERVNND